VSPFELAFGAFKIRQRQRKPDGQKFKVIMKRASDEKDWFLAVFSGKGGGDGQKMMRVGDNGGDPWKVARARQGLACSGSAAETNLQKNLPHPSTSEVGRFLRKRLVSRHGPPAEIGPPQTRTARRSVPTLEVLGLHLGGQKIPHPSASEVGRFLRKRLVRRHGLPQRSVRGGHGSLGDRSLPRRSSGGLRGAKNQLSVTV